MNLIDGKLISRQIKEDLKIEVKKLKEKGIIPGLGIILVGNNTSSEIYVRNKLKVCEELGINGKLFRFNEQNTESEIIAKIKELDNNDDLYMEMLSQPPLVNKHLPNIEDLRVFLYNIVQKGNMPFVKNPHGISEAKFLRQENQMLKDEIYALKQRKSFPFIKTVVKHGYLKYYLLGINIYKKKL